MRIVIDMQGAQSPTSRLHSIGRYTLGLVKAMAECHGKHELVLALNGTIQDGIDEIRAALGKTLPRDAFRLWYPVPPTAYPMPGSAANRAVSSEMYAEFLASLKPDVVLFTSLFEGVRGNYCCEPEKLRGRVPLASILYDFLPKKNPEQYLSKSLRSWYEERFAELLRMDLLLAISNATALDAKTCCPGVKTISISSGCGGFFHRVELPDAEKNALQTKLGITKPFVLYAGGLDARKNLPALLAAFSRLPGELQETHQLVIPCGGRDDLRSQLLAEAVRNGLAGGTFVAPLHVSDVELRALYSLCELFVFPSLEEGFALPALEAMRCGAPVIGSRASSIPEIIGLDWALFDPRDVDDITEKMKKSLTDAPFRAALLQNGKERASLFSWEASARRAFTALEALADESPAPSFPDMPEQDRVRRLCKTVTASLPKKSNKICIADCICRTFSESARPQLLIDIGALAKNDARTGIQRVSRSVTAHLVRRPPQGYDVRPVYAAPDRNGYLYAHNSSIRLFGFDDGLNDDAPVDFSRHDLFLGLDLQLEPVQRQLPALNLMRRHGVQVYFVVYDLLPLRFPDYFGDDVRKSFEDWVRAIGQFDGILGISRAVADETRDWLAANTKTMPELFTWFHLGSDLEASLPTRGFPHEAPETLRAIASRPSLLMVSTIEPRKGHRLALSAFKRLWAHGVDVNLVIVGKLGWKMDDFAEKLRNHPEQGRRLFWLTGVSDEYLDKIYEASTAVLMASEGEGFGLAIVEGARHGKPLILRDIPVFHEVAGENAAYFSGADADNLRAVIENWLHLYAEGKAPSSAGIRCLSWEESANMLVERLPLNRA